MYFNKEICILNTIKKFYLITPPLGGTSTVYPNKRNNSTMSHTDKDKRVNIADPIPPSTYLVALPPVSSFQISCISTRRPDARTNSLFTATLPQMQGPHIRLHRNGNTPTDAQAVQAQQRFGRRRGASWDCAESTA